MSETILHVLFIAWFVLVALSVVDSLGDLLFWPLTYGLGLRVLSQDEPTLQPSSTPVGTVFETANGKFKTIDPGVTLARQRYGLIRSRTQVRGRIVYTGAMVRFEARVSWITVVAPLVMLIFVAVTDIASQAEFLAVVIVFIFGVTGVNVYMSRRHALAILEEYRAWVAQPGGSAG